MMRQFKIATIKTTEKLRYYQETLYEFKPTKYKWLASFMKRILFKINAIRPHYGEMIEVKSYGEPEAKKLNERVIQLIERSRYNNQAPKDLVLLMGVKSFDELMMSDSFFTDSMIFTSSVHYNNGYGPSIFGVDVCVIPDMEGEVIVEKKFIEKRG